MSKKSEARKAAYIEARRRSVLPILLGMSVMLEHAWTLEGKKDGGVEYPPLDMSKENKKRVLGKWAQITRWRDAYCMKVQDTLGAYYNKSVVWRDMVEKHRMMEAAIDRHSKGGVQYGHALSVETLVVSFLTDDYCEIHQWKLPREFLWYRRTLMTMSQWTCPPGDSLNLLANMVYYDVRDQILEFPDWSQLWHDEPMSEQTKWINDNPDSEFSKAAQKWCLEKFGRPVRSE